MRQIAMPSMIFSDKKRLDWLEKQDGAIIHVSYGEYRYYFGSGHGKVRTVIDEAIQADQPKRKRKPK